MPLIPKLIIYTCLRLRPLLSLYLQCEIFDAHACEINVNDECNVWEMDESSGPILASFTIHRPSHTLPAQYCPHSPMHPPIPIVRFKRNEFQQKPQLSILGLLSFML